MMAQPKQPKMRKRKENPEEKQDDENISPTEEYGKQPRIDDSEEIQPKDTLISTIIEISATDASVQSTLDPLSDIVNTF